MLRGTGVDLPFVESGKKVLMSIECKKSQSISLVWIIVLIGSYIKIGHPQFSVTGACPTDCMPRTNHKSPTKPW